MLFLQLLLYCLLFTAMVKLAVGNHAVNGLYFYPQPVQDRAIALGLTDRETVRRKFRHFLTAFYLVMLAALLGIVGIWNGVRDFRVLLFDYPQALRTNQELVVGMHAFFQALGVQQPVFLGASDGGMVAQIYTQRYPGQVGGMVLISTGGMDAETLKSLRRKYFLAPLMLWYMKHCNYEKLKPRLIQASMRHIRNESPEEIAYAQDMFETIFRDYPQEKDVHISTLLADLMNQRPVTAEDFRALKGNILLILPDQDFFSGKMQQDLIRLMWEPEIAYVSGGHLSTVLKAGDYIRTIRAFLGK